MWTLSRVIGMGILCGLSVADIQFRRIPAEWLVLASLAVAVRQIFLSPLDPWLAAGGAAVGSVFLLISKMTDQSLGYADSWAILLLGIFLGLWDLLEVLAAALCLLGAVSMWILARRRSGRKCRLPFYPFLTAGYIICICTGGDL